jgi:hypothetical protein
MTLRIEAPGRIWCGPVTAIYADRNVHAIALEGEKGAARP